MKRNIWLWLGIFLILLNIALIINDYKVSGWDFNIYHAAVKTYASGENPYSVINLQKHLGKRRYHYPFLYPPITLGFFNILHTMVSYCNQIASPKAYYYFLWCVLLAAVFLIIRKANATFNPLFLIILLFTGFISAYWNFLTGNIGIVELFFFSLVFYYITKKNNYLSAFFLAIIGIIKIIPLIFGSLFAFSKQSKAQKARIFGGLASLFMASNIISYAMDPKLFVQYYKFMIRRLSIFYNPLKEVGEYRSPAIFLYIKEITNHFFNGNLTMFFAQYFLLLCIIFVLFTLYLRKRERSFLDIYSFGMLALIIILPRMKPYSFTLALLPIYFLVKDQNWERKLWTIIIVSGMPLISYWAIKTSHNQGFLRFMEYGQSLSLLVFYVLYFVNDCISRAVSPQLCKKPIENVQDELVETKI
ncbi:MAG: glycosyltransferase 87 family protein [Candidatus Aminicenantes bacterium]|nr:glycosyltransferase 87 family protein [Candidatus Aminicenantes bacterium]